MSNRKPLVIGVSVVVIIIVLGYLLYLFQPWALFTNKTVDEAPPTIASSATTTPGAATASPTKSIPPVRSGTFISYEHETTGTASLITAADGTQIVRLTDFRTSNGPDVKVWLSMNPASKAEDSRDAKYVNLGDIKGNIGNQNYVVPASADGTPWRSVVIWCDRFSVPFGAANLT